MNIELIEPSPPATLPDVERAEADLGFSLPREYRDYLLTHANGGWVRSALLPDFPDVGVNHILGVSRDDAYDLVGTCARLVPLVELGFLPVADSAGGNPICVSLRLEDAGTIWFNDHELHYDEPGALVKLANSWDAFLTATQPDETPRQTPAGTAKGWVSPQMEAIIRSQFAE